MEKISTLNKIILFHYDDIPYPDRVEMATILSLDERAKAEYISLKETLSELPKVTFLPAESTLKKIFQYSRHAV